MNALSIFEKYLGEQSPTTATFSTNIHYLNQVVGALQTLSLALKQCQQTLHNPQELESIIQRCLFMKEALFEREILIPDTQKSIYISHLGTMLKDHSKEEVSCYIQAKQEEITQLLEGIFKALEGEEHYNYEQSHLGARF